MAVFTLTETKSSSSVCIGEIAIMNMSDLKQDYQFRVCKVTYSSDVSKKCELLKLYTCLQSGFKLGNLLLP